MVRLMARLIIARFAPFSRHMKLRPDDRVVVSDSKQRAQSLFERYTLDLTLPSQTLFKIRL